MAAKTFGSDKAKTIIGGIGSWAGIISYTKLAAFIVWITSTYATSVLIDDLRGGTYAAASSVDNIVYLLWGSPFIAAIALQAVFTIAESPVWKGTKPGVVAYSALVMDTLVNAAAIYPFTRNFGASKVWYFLSDSLGVDSAYSNYTILIITLFMGIMLAAAPEKLWSGNT